MASESDSRSIDFAKNASIDMMTLNNKVVNMRQVVKRTKVHIINKLCHQISILKKKKGTDEQKTQNIRKAERLIEEIDSIKKLKEDKVSKYALANTSSFEEVSKITTSAGPRALARLADHNLIKTVVKEFRDKHSDWRDLAAFLLVKQTGRRFKTKKQKQTKLSKSVENINASEMMTKAYIHERFGNEGLVKAELKFEQKRKRKASAMKQTDTSVKEDKPSTDTEKNFQEPIVESDRVIEKKTIVESEPALSKKKKLETERLKDHVEKEIEKKAHKNESISQEVDDISRENGLDNSEDSSSENENSTSVSEKGHLSQTSINVSRVSDEIANTKFNVNVSSNEMQEDSLPNIPKKNECVVKKLKLSTEGEDSSDSDISENDGSEEIDEENDTSNSQSSDSENNHAIVKETKISKRQQKNEKKKLPTFLTTLTHKTVKDPFFADSDDEDVPDVDALAEDDRGHFSDDDDVDDSTGKSKISSMFHNPHNSYEGKDGATYHHQRGGRGRFSNDRGWRGDKTRGNFRGRGGWGREDSGRFERGDDTHRGKSFRGRAGGGRPSPRSGRDFSGRSRSFGGQSGVFDEKVGNKSRQDDNQFRFNDDGRKQTPSISGTTSVSEEKLHPSWEASKRRKAEQSGIAAFKGSKITFDDD